jgi:hypothetical protein
MREAIRRAGAGEKLSGEEHDRRRAAARHRSGRCGAAGAGARPPRGSPCRSPRGSPGTPKADRREDRREDRQERREESRDAFRDRIRETREAAARGQAEVIPRYARQGQRNQERYERQLREERRDRRDARREWRRDRDYLGWQNDWRRDRRYDWQRYRYSNRHIFRPGRYYSPYRDHSYSRFSIGFFLQPGFFSNRYWINDPWQYRLPAVELIGRDHLHVRAKRAQLVDELGRVADDHERRAIGGAEPGSGLGGASGETPSIACR